MNIIEYDITSSKVDSDKSIAVCSDVHISSKTSDKKLKTVLESLAKIKPTHIVIPGDLYDPEGNRFYNNKAISDFINGASGIADVFYVKGNIDGSKMLLPHGLYNGLHSDNFHLLCEDNGNGCYNVVSHNGLGIAGIRLPQEFYSLSEDERVEYLAKNYKEYLEEISSQCSSDKFNVLLCHDPIIAKLSILKDLNFDLVISGHNHGGIWPKCIKPLLKLTKADLELFYPTYTKGMIDIGNGKKEVISEGITRFHTGFGVLSSLEALHEGTIETVKIKTKHK